MAFIKLKKYLPNLLTFCNMAIGMMVIFTMIQHNALYDRRLACYFICLAAVLDGLDGCLARYLNAVSNMGKQLDSFADIITFGVAPVTIFISNLQYIPWFIMLFLLFYTLAGAFRLARYNLQGRCGYFTGLPITVSGCILVSVSLINSYFQSEYTKGFMVLYLLLILALSMMMVSKFRVNRIIK